MSKVTPLVKFLSQAAKRLGVAEHVYVVGGAVRNFVLGLPPKDVDIVIDSVALRGKDSEWFSEQLQRFIPTSTNLTTNQYGVAILTVSGPWVLDGHDMQGEVLEIANARKESYGDPSGKGYKPSVCVRSFFLTLTIPLLTRGSFWRYRSPRWIKSGCLRLTG